MQKIINSSDIHNHQKKKGTIIFTVPKSRGSLATEQWPSPSTNLPAQVSACRILATNGQIKKPLFGQRGCAKRSSAPEKFTWGWRGGGLGAPPPPPPGGGSKGQLSFFHIFHAYLKSPTPPPNEKAAMQQERDTKGKRFHPNNIEPHRVTTFRHFRRQEWRGGGLCLVNIHCPPPFLKSLEARFQAFVLGK